MLYIGPWHEYILAKQLEKGTSGRPGASRLPHVESSTASSPAYTPARPKRSTLPQIASKRPTKGSAVRSCPTSRGGYDVDECIPTVSSPHASQRRDFYGETRSLRRFQNELASLGSPRPSKASRRPGKPSNCEVSGSTNKRIAQIQRMQNIYRQGKVKAQAQARGKQRQDTFVLPSVYQEKKSLLRKSDTRQVGAAMPTDDEDEGDDLLAWVGGLDLSDV